ncbi:MAG: helix-turn-helix domain-containing protein [Anaerotignaceae bacterium]
MYIKFEDLLKKRNVTAYEVSKSTGVLQSTLSDWKNGKYTPKLDKLQAIANYFNVPITYFLEEEV